MDADKTSEPPPNVLLMIAMAAGMWGLVCLGAAGVWPHHVNSPEISRGEHVPQLASLADPPLVYLPSRIRAKAKRQRRPGPSLTARVFNASTSSN